ncbi:hypothetical protein FB45DRAFT_1063387 [Roridomyces roridus]|uniref:Uncharacterized protein n=1 Tax=Roridomyces roridus TaxID=1738132 RepID=A0AAD7FDN3_9AGAR|nr:hypothetical protein FB45DRAFT_1063387 [Roridomyces roridus]
MFKVLSLAILSAVLIGVVANPLPDPQPNLASRDLNSFIASAQTLESTCSVFLGEFYDTFPPNVTILQQIAGHIEDCSNAFGASVIQLASIIPTPAGAGKGLTTAQATTINNFVGTTGAVLSHLNQLQEDVGFFDGVAVSGLDGIYCHAVQDLALRSTTYLGLLVIFAPSTTFSGPWDSLHFQAVNGFTIFLSEDGFNCGGGSF